jgi:hypothetical protein
MVGWSMRRIRRGVTTAGVVLAIGSGTLGVLGIAHAQQPPTPTPGTPSKSAEARKADMRAGMAQRHQQLLDAVATKLGISGDRLRQAMEEARNELGVGGPGGRFERGPGRPGGQMGPLAGPRAALFGQLDTAANAIGITVEQLRQELPGKSLADVARAHNVDAKRVADALNADAAARIDQQVRDGHLPADRAAQMKEQLRSRIDQRVTQQAPQMQPRGPRAGAPGAFGRPQGQGSPAPAPARP